MPDALDHFAELVAHPHAKMKPSTVTRNSDGTLSMTVYDGDTLARPVTVHIPEDLWQKFTKWIDSPDNLLGFDLELLETMYRVTEREYLEPHLYLIDNGEDHPEWRLVEEGYNTKN